MVTDISVASGAEQSIRNRVGYHIGIRVAIESVRVWDLNSTQNETAPMY